MTWIDGLRGVAVLIVLLYHHWGFSGYPDLRFGFFDVADLMVNGLHGVHIFFVISGFCLAWPYSGPEGKSLADFRLGAFFKQRFRRLAPAYYTALVLSAIPVFAAVLTKTGRIPGGLWQDLLMHGLFIHNVSPEYVTGFNMALWTISLQFQFYLLFPFFLWLLLRAGPVRLALLVLAGQIIFRLAIWPFIADNGELYRFLAYAPWSRMFEFAAGMAIARLIRGGAAHQDGGKPAWWAMASIVVPGALAWFLSRESGRMHPAVDPLWGVCTAGLIALGFSAGWWRHVLESPTLKFCGVCSYSVFLIHHPIGSWLYHHFYFEERFPVSLRATVMIAYVPLMIGAGWIFYRRLEKPFLKAGPAPV